MAAADPVAPGTYTVEVLVRYTTTIVEGEECRVYELVDEARRWGEIVSFEVEVGDVAL